MEAMDRIRINPYCIARDIPHGGFEIADTIGRNMHLPADDPERIQTCLLHLLHQSVTDGHLFQYEHTLVKNCSRLLQLETEQIRPILNALINSDEIVVETPDLASSNESHLPRIYLKELYRAEFGIAQRLHAMLSVPLSSFSMETEQITEEILNQLAIQLSEQQLHVVQTVLQHRIAIITGGPGTGKTTLIRSIAALFQRMGRKTLLAAPTGRAARRLSEVSRKKAVTIHKLLRYNQTDGQFENNRDNPLETDAVIVDEASMIDTYLMYHLLEAIPLKTRLILVGDRFQLPSVGPGNILSDLIDSKTIMTFELKEIFRQARESAIILTAHEVRRGNFPDMQRIQSKGELSEFYFIEQHDPLRVVDIIAELCQNRITRAFGHIDEIQVLTPMHKGEIGTIHLNQVLQHTLNPGSHGIETRSGTFKTGDKVMHLKNNYPKEVFNGDIGVICGMDKTENQLTVDYEGRTVAYDFSELTELSLAYAISVHKSQGSEYEAVIIPIMTQHFPLLQRNLLYTAITRGKELVILIGTPKALSIALHNDKPRQRLSGLQEKLFKLF
jgi:exodeoxyribonuclease V alpha subunit